MTLSTRTRNCLANLGLPLNPEKVAAMLTTRDLMHIPNLGKKSREEVKAWVEEHGYTINAIPFGERLRIEIEERAELARLKAKYE